MQKSEIIKKLNKLYNTWMQFTMDTDNLSYDEGYEQGKIHSAYELEVLIQELEKLDK